MQHYLKFYVLKQIKSVNKTIFGITNITFTFAENRKPLLYGFLLKK
jgi:hypothetical protein